MDTHNIVNFCIENNVSENNQSIVLEYLKDLNRSGMKEATVRNNEHFLRFLLTHTKTDLDKLTKKDVNDIQDAINDWRKKNGKPNICIRLHLPYHSKLLERKVYTDQQYTYINTLQPIEIERYLPDIWYPSITTHPKNRYKWSSKKAVVSDDLVAELNNRMSSQSKDCINSDSTPIIIQSYDS